MHLTNNAVQKHCKNYGQFEDGNQLSFSRFQEYIDEHYPEAGISVKNDLLPTMKNIIAKSLLAARKKIDPNKRKHCFELFGYDFIVDTDFNLWLIEVNTNPCIEESSELLKKYLRRMIEDMLRLAVDPLFPRPRPKKVKKTRAESATMRGSTNSQC